MDTFINIACSFQTSAGTSSNKYAPSTCESGENRAFKEENLQTKYATSTSAGTSSSTSAGTSNNKYAPYLPLLKAVRNGDLEEVKSFLDTNPRALTAAISFFGTALHVAAMTEHVSIVEELVNRMNRRDDYAILNEYGESIISLAASGGVLKMAELVLAKNTTMLAYENKWGNIPVLMAAYHGHADMTRYLYRLTPKEVLHPDRSKLGLRLATVCIIGDIYDIALDLLEKHPRLATEVVESRTTPTILVALSYKSSAFKSGSKLHFWQKWIYSCINVRPSTGGNMITRVPVIKHIYDEKMKHAQVIKLLSCTAQRMSISNGLEGFGVKEAVSNAIRLGIVEFIVELGKAYPDFMMRHMDELKRTIFSFATKERQEMIFNLIYQLGPFKGQIADTVDECGNNLLHYAAFLAPPDQLHRISGAALQMQRELQWFKEVEKIVQPVYKERRNKRDQTPADVFTVEHKVLVQEGEKWMKDTATSCTVVAALTATIMFAAAFTVPGGYDEKSGVPRYLHRNSFMVFIVADALSLFSSTTSVLMFSGILTSRYREEDFLKSLPTKLIIGLFTLFFSIATMMITFGVTLVIVLQERLPWISLPIVLIACIPVTLFALLQFPLLYEIFISTYGPGIFYKPKGLWYQVMKFISFIQPKVW